MTLLVELLVALVDAMIGSLFTLTEDVVVVVRTGLLVELLEVALVDAMIGATPLAALVVVAVGIVVLLVRLLEVVVDALIGAAALAALVVVVVRVVLVVETLEFVLTEAMIGALATLAVVVEVVVVGRMEVVVDPSIGDSMPLPSVVVVVVLTPMMEELLRVLPSIGLIERLLLGVGLVVERAGPFKELKLVRGQ